MGRYVLQRLLPRKKLLHVSRGNKIEPLSGFVYIGRVMMGGVGGWKWSPRRNEEDGRRRWR
jgi:hypothetical protein